MKIKEITFENRNDFKFIAECEHCGHTCSRGDGYDDHFYHKSVIPNWHCPSCGVNAHGKAKVEAAE